MLQGGLMNVKESNTITRCIENLRKDAYNTDLFKDIFKAELIHHINAIDVEFIPEQLGGFSIRINVDRNACADSIPMQHSECYMAGIIKGYCNILNDMFKLYPRLQYIEEDFQKICADNNISNLINVIISGSNEIIVKI